VVLALSGVGEDRPVRRSVTGFRVAAVVVALSAGIGACGDDGPDRVEGVVLAADGPTSTGPTTPATASPGAPPASASASTTTPPPIPTAARVPDPAGRDMTPDTGPGIPPLGPIRVLVLGDGVMFDAEPGLVAALEGTGRAEVTTRSVFGMGITRASWVDFRSTWAAEIAEDDPDLVVVLVGPWDVHDVPADGSSPDAPTAPSISPLDAAWPALYGSLLDEATAILTVGGAEVWWLPMLPEAGPDRSLRVAAQAAAVRGLDERRSDVFSPDVHAAFLDAEGGVAAGEIGPDGVLVPWRKPDGQHLCPEGVVHLVDVLRDPLFTRFGLVPPPGWESGGWRSDGRYAFPVEEACPTA
jgi:hypothetical protein